MKFAGLGLRSGTTLSARGGLLGTLPDLVADQIMMLLQTDVASIKNMSYLQSGCVCHDRPGHPFPSTIHAVKPARA
jgi:hypothetical protein